MNRFKRYIENLKTVQTVATYLKSKTFPGSDNVSWYAVIGYLWSWVDNREIGLKAKALSFTFILALFPSVIFIFSFLAYIPFVKTGDQFLVFFENILPQDVYEASRVTLLDILKKQRSGLLSLGFITAVYFSTNGFVSLINVLDRYNEHKKRKRSFWKQRLVAIILSVIVAIALIASVSILTGANVIFNYLDKFAYFPSKISPYLIGLLNYTIVSAIIFTIVSSIYYFAPSYNPRWKFISPGAVFASAVIIVTTFLFSTYVNAFNSYNKVYGSIGVLIVVMLLIHINTYILLLGYELNFAIDKTVATVKKSVGKKSNKLILINEIEEEGTTPLS